MKQPKVGKLKERITIQAAVKVPDGAGGNIETWVNASTIWAEDMPGGSSRVFDALQNKINSRVAFRVRDGAGISKKNRIIYDDHICIVEGIRDWEQTDEFKIIETVYTDGTVGVGSDGGTTPITSGLNGKYLSFAAGDTVIVDLDLVGKSFIAIFRNGIGPKMITSGTPTWTEALIDASSGSVTFGSSLNSGEYIYAIYG